eukprot:TRINITY_DN1614_c0_g1_i13.p1 TRINITY_DN1614_c0_g1~~TRINITY_DN1614_c0_g1_i13.p1  ORF type:complete len:491 (+),score=92.81 TRINITY_DN1614_c0_g1_i13:593-2065(+)
MIVGSVEGDAVTHVPAAPAASVAPSTSPAPAKSTTPNTAAPAASATPSARAKRPHTASSLSQALFAGPVRPSKKLRTNDSPVNKFFLCVTEIVNGDKQKAYYCNNCKQRYTGSTTSRKAHLMHVHKMTEEDIVAGQIPGDHQHESRLVSIENYVKSTACAIPDLTLQELQVTLFFVMHGAPFTWVQSPYTKPLLGRMLDGPVTTDQLHKWLDIVYEFTLNKFKALAKGKPCALTIDGAKDISGNKLCAINATINGVSYLVRLHNLAMGEVTADVHRKVITDEVNSLEQLGCVPLGLTCDNEASQQAGLRQSISSALHFLLPVRCFAHTIELVVHDVVTACPQLNAIVFDVHYIVSDVRNHKDKLRALLQHQTTQYITNPLRLVMCNNMRKWYGAYLECECLLQLSPFVAVLGYTVPPNLSLAVQLLRPFKEAIDVAQRESGHLIDGAIAFQMTLDGIVQIQPPPIHAERQPLISAAVSYAKRLYGISPGE